MSLKSVEETLRSYLGLKYHLVGVKLINRDISMRNISQPETAMAFCQMIREASTKGESFLSGLETERCPTAQAVLGFRDLKYLKIDYRVMPAETRKVLISPLNDIGDVPEVVLAILTPKQMMDLAIILQSGKGTPLSAEFKGNHACAEFFGKPYLKGLPNISLLCNGAREIYSDFRDNEFTFGAPFETYVQAAEAIERLEKIGGTLCGCRASDLPSEIINEFAKFGFSKGTDYFFGKINGRNVRVYLNKDLNGILKLITIYLPMKTPSEDVAEKLAEKLRPLISRPYFVNRRGYWLDLTARASEDALGIDLFDGSSIKVAVEKFVEKMAQYMKMVERIQPNED